MDRCPTHALAPEMRRQLAAAPMVDDTEPTREFIARWSEWYAETDALLARLDGAA